MTDEIYLNDHYHEGIPTTKKLPKMEIILSERQEDAIGYFRKNQDTGVLIGYAGTGKTTCVMELIKEKLNAGYNVCCLAFTNKAVKILRRTAEQFGVFEMDCPFLTIHSALGLKIYDKDPNEQDPQEIFHASNFVVVDECSMLSPYLMTTLEKHQYGRQILFMGDPCQLPPVTEGKVKKVELSKSFDIANKFILTKVIRQQGPLVNYLLDIREHVESKKHFKPYETDIIRNIEDYEFLSAFTPEWCEDPDQFRVIGYHHKNLAEWNTGARERIFKSENLDKFLPGDYILCSAPVQRKSRNSRQIITIYTTATELYVMEVEPFEFFNGWQGYHLVVHDGSKDLKNIFVLDESYNSQWKAVSESLNKQVGTAGKALKMARKNNHEDSDKVKQAKRNFALVKEKQDSWYCTFDRVRYAYAISVYNSQGSTFKSGMVDSNDFSGLNYVGPGFTDLYNRAWYTAATRFREGFLMFD